MKKALALLPILLTLASSPAAAAPATVTGPLGDAQLVRGKKLGMTYLHYGASGADPSALATVHYGFHGSTGSTATMSGTGYGNQVAFLDVPADASDFRYTLTVSDGTVQDDGGKPFVIAVGDRAVSVAKAAPGAPTILVRYAGPVSTTYDTYLHLGWNDWNQIGDAFMARTQFSYTKAGATYDYNSVELSPPWWASYLDFVVKDARGGASWDNNDGHDWHTSLHPFVTTNVYRSSPTTTYVTVTYADGGLNPPVLRYGTDGWQTPTDVAMSAVYGGYQAQVALPASARSMELAFHDGNGRWENNYGMNWSVALR